MFKISLSHIIFASLVFVSRFGVLPPNFSPLGAFGFFGKSLPLYFGVIVLFDLFFGGFYSGFIFTYIGFAGYFIFGIIAKDKIIRQLLLLPIASFFFFLASNFGAFLAMYPQTFEGLVSAYAMALPFYTNTILGDLVFGYGFIAIYQILKIWKPTLLKTGKPA